MLPSGADLWRPTHLFVGQLGSDICNAETVFGSQGADFFAPSTPPLRPSESGQLAFMSGQCVARQPLWLARSPIMCVCASKRHPSCCETKSHAAFPVAPEANEQMRRDRKTTRL